MLKEAKQPLFKELDVLKVKIQSQEKAITDNASEIILQEEALEGLLSLAKEANNKLSVAETSLTEVNERTEHSLSENKRQSDVKELLQADISELETYNNILHSETTEAEALKMKLIEDIQGLETEYTEKKEQNDKNIEFLDAQILEKSQNIETIQEKEYLIRTDLAKWQKRLEDQDKNLRIRELKVQEGETKIVQNANLLNL